MRAADAQDDGEDRDRSHGAEYRPGRDVDGIDLAVIAHTDLALGLDVPLQLDHRDFVAARSSRRRPAAARGKAAGCAVANPEHGRQWVAKGSRLVLCSGDIWLLSGALAAGIERLRE
jgi:2-keto-3-deoxy-L-rhamnonate aldolase RhmA